MPAEVTKTEPAKTEAAKTAKLVEAKGKLLSVQRDIADYLKTNFEDPDAAQAAVKVKAAIEMIDRALKPKA
jgi:hypothetical protein